MLRLAELLLLEEIELKLSELEELLDPYLISVDSDPEDIVLTLYPTVELELPEDPEYPPELYELDTLVTVDGLDEPL